MANKDTSQWDRQPIESLSILTGLKGFHRLATAAVHRAETPTTPDAWASATGDDLVTNGAFAADTDWTKGTGWTIAAGVASSDGTQVGDADLTQDITAVTGVVYEVTFTVSGYSAGNVTPVVGDTEGTDRAADGTFTEIITAGAGTDIDIRADVDFVGNIDNVVVKVAAAYAVGDYVLNDSVKYICLQAHDSDAAVDEPGTGSSWTDYWKVLVQYDIQEFVKLRAVKAAVTLGEGCVAATDAGDPPADADTITQDGEFFCRLTSVDLDSGILYAYFI